MFSLNWSPIVYYFVMFSRFKRIHNWKLPRGALLVNLTLVIWFKNSQTLLLFNLSYCQTPFAHLRNQCPVKTKTEASLHYFDKFTLKLSYNSIEFQLCNHTTPEDQKANLTLQGCEKTTTLYKNPHSSVRFTHLNQSHDGDTLSIE